MLAKIAAPAAASVRGTPVRATLLRAPLPCASMPRAALLRGLLLLAGALLVAPAAQAQKYPARTVRIVVPFPAGSAPDQTARIVAQELQGSMNQSFVVDNKPGAQGAIAAVEVAKSPNDGTIMVLDPLAEIPDFVTPLRRDIQMRVRADKRLATARVA